MERFLVCLALAMWAAFVVPTLCGGLPKATHPTPEVASAR